MIEYFCIIQNVQWRSFCDIFPHSSSESVHPNLLINKEKCLLYGPGTINYFLKKQIMSPLY